LFDDRNSVINEFVYKTMVLVYTDTASNDGTKSTI